MRQSPESSKRSVCHLQVILQRKIIVRQHRCHQEMELYRMGWEGMIRPFTEPASIFPFNAHLLYLLSTQILSLLPNVLLRVCLFFLNIWHILNFYSSYLYCFWIALSTMVQVLSFELVLQHVLIPSVTEKDIFLCKTPRTSRYVYWILTLIQHDLCSNLSRHSVTLKA